MTAWTPSYYIHARAELEAREREYSAAIDEWESYPELGRERIEKAGAACESATEHKSAMYETFQDELAIRLQIATLNRNAVGNTAIQNKIKQFIGVGAF
jgi:hypothetical protein